MIFNPAAVEVLEELKRSTGKDVPDIVRDALGFYNWVRKQIESGNTLAMNDRSTNITQEYRTPFEKGYNG